MNINDLRPARDFARHFGVKAVVYGGPGSGKTPLINTAPRPVMLACEPGLLSMRGSTVPTFQAFTPDLIDEFFKWLFGSNEAKNFDTIAVDSASQMAEIYLAGAEKGTSKSGNKMHGLAAYGEMAKRTLEHLEPLYFMMHKHAYIICKQELSEEGNLKVKRPYFPGNMLPASIPYKYDQVLHLDIQNIPGHGQYKAFRCIGTIDVMARDRTGQLSEFEPPNFGELIKKAIS